MSITRRDTIKSILSAAAAISAVPAVAKVVLKTNPPTKAESIHARIKKLISKIETIRESPINGRMDYIGISLPFNCNRDEISSCFFKEFPELRPNTSFNNFQTWDCLMVNINRGVYHSEDLFPIVRIDPSKSYWAKIEFSGNSEVHSIGRRDFFLLTPSEQPEIQII